MNERFLLHASDSKNWRLRNVQEHPLDPGWENGTYSICHRNFRKKANARTIVFDVIVKEHRAVVRSAFRISGSEGKGHSRILFFDEIEQKEKVISFVERYLNSPRKTLRTEAENFLKKWG